MKYRGEGKYIRRTGGLGAHGHCVIELEGSERGSGVKFINALTGGVLPKEYISPIESGVKEALLEGYVAGYPIIDVCVTLIDGSYHEVDSSGDHFKIAAKFAVKDACSRAPMCILEPILDVEITSPSEFFGSIIGDLTRRRGNIVEILSESFRAKVPASEMFGYASDLRSLTQGRATFTTTPYNYEELPQNLSDKLIKL